MPPLPLESPTRPPRTRPVVIALAALLAACGAARAGDADVTRDGDTDRPYWRTNLFGRVLTDQRYLVETWWPQEFRRPSFAAPVLGATIAALRSADDRDGEGVDFSALHAMEPGPSSDTRRSASALTDLGDGAVVAAALGITYFGARRAGSDSLAGRRQIRQRPAPGAGPQLQALLLRVGRHRHHAFELRADRAACHWYFLLYSGHRPRDQRRLQHRDRA